MLNRWRASLFNICSEIMDYLNPLLEIEIRAQPVDFGELFLTDLGTKLKFSSAYHPQTDGQSEIADLTILDLLRCYAHDTQSQWEKY